MREVEIEQEALTLLKKYKDLRAFDKARKKMTAQYGNEDYLAIRRRFALLWLDVHSSVITLEKKPAPTISPEKRAENRAKRIEKKKKIKEGTLAYASNKVKRKRGHVHVSLPSSRRNKEAKEKGKTPPARIIYTPMGNKR